MASARNLMTAKPATGTGEASGPEMTEVTKEDLQRRMDDARESISQTVGEIRGTVEDQYASVKATVSGALDFRDAFRQEPILWSVGALSAGFAFGYTLGLAQKRRRRSGGKGSALAAFAESFIQELSNAGSHLPLLSLDPQVRALLGFDLSELLAEIGGSPRRSTRNVQAKKKLLSRRREKISRKRLRP
jgi:hypothetical protein